jgi:hypothetical protein
MTLSLRAPDADGETSAAMAARMARLLV